MNDRDFYNNDDTVELFDKRQQAQGQGKQIITEAIPVAAEVLVRLLGSEIEEIRLRAAIGILQAAATANKLK